jgi:hypothetical protein
MIGHCGVFVNRKPDAVAAEFPHHPVTAGFGVIPDSPGNLVEPRTGL